MAPLPPELLEADARLHALHAAIRFSAYLNPVNVAEARQAFARGAEAPPFSYAPADFAGDALAELDALRIPGEHPLGLHLAGAVAETRAMVVALRDRTAEAFEALTVACGWDPGEGADPPSVEPATPRGAEIPAEDVVAALREALRARALEGWTVAWDPVMSARVLVDAAKRQIRVNPAARFRENDRAGLVAHEIDVHVLRGANGLLQPLRAFSTGLGRALLAEEGLALHAEERTVGLAPGFLARQEHTVAAVRAARGMGFRPLYEHLKERVGSGTAWGISLRVKRGLSDPGGPGVYAKDAVYLLGYRAVEAFLAGGGDVRGLYVGKVGLHHPVDAWLAAGVVTPPAIVPALWGG